MFFIVFLFCISFVLGVTCPDDRIVLKLSDGRNAHAGDYDSSYGIVLCAPEGRTINHNSGTPLISLSDSTNAHLKSGTTDSAYGVGIEFGDWDCLVEQNSCSVGDASIELSLSSTTNAHVSLGDDDNYPVKVCCGEPGVPVVEESNPRVFWMNALGQETTESVIDEVVALIAEDFVPTQFSEEENVIFKIYEDNWLVADDFIREFSVTTIPGNSDVSSSWTITQADWDAGGSLEDGEMEFYFKIIGQNSGPPVPEKSGLLRVTETVPAPPVTCTSNDDCVDGEETCEIPEGETEGMCERMLDNVQILSWGFCEVNVKRVENECETTGKISYFVNTIWTKPTDPPGEDEKKCEFQDGSTILGDCTKQIAKLPVFTLLNALIVVAIIAFFYLVRNGLKARKGKKGKKNFEKGKKKQ